MKDDETVLVCMRMFEDLDAFNLFKIRKQVGSYAVDGVVYFDRSSKDKRVCIASIYIVMYLTFKIIHRKTTGIIT